MKKLMKKSIQPWLLLLNKTKQRWTLKKLGRIDADDQPEHYDQRVGLARNAPIDGWGAESTAT